MILYYYLLTHIPAMLWMGIRTRLLVQVLVRRLKVEGFLYLQSSENLRIVPVDEAPVQGTFLILILILVWFLLAFGWLGICTIISMIDISIVYVSLSLTSYVADNFSHATYMSMEGDCSYRTERNDLLLFGCAVVLRERARVCKRKGRFPNSSRCPVQILGEQVGAV
jgi:hypothetical protein